MNILFDINHPAHVHFFKNLIKWVQGKNYNYIVTIRDKEITAELLDKYEINYRIASKQKKGILGFISEYFQHQFFIYKTSKKENIDLIISLGGVLSSLAAWLLRIKHYSFWDTEHSKLQHKLNKPFTNKIFTPDCYMINEGPKQVRYQGYHELAYLHPNRFTPNTEVLKEIGLTEQDKFFVVRFVSWEASHDKGQKGLSLENKRKLIETLKHHGKIIISSEKELPAEFEEYRMSICPTKMHDLLYYATLLYGESATMSSECAVLGTHSIFIDFAGRGYTDEQEKKYDLVYNFKTDIDSINNSLIKLEGLLKINNLKEIGRNKKVLLLKDKIDVTEWMFGLINNKSTAKTQKHLK